jgi:2-isopropylmalate synthase
MKMGASSYDWSLHVPAAEGAPSLHRCPPTVKVVDETLRDGLQAASCKNPALGVKLAMLHAMAGVGVNVVSIGMPAAGARHAEDTVALAREIAGARLPLVPTAAARTMDADIDAVARVAERAGIGIEVYAFLGTSAIRQLVEGWDLAFLVKAVATAGTATARAGLPFCLVTEDTTRSAPEVLHAVFGAAIDAGASRLCLCDTTGFASPLGASELVAFTQRELAAAGADHVGLDWHGHNDRGRALPVALYAASLGVERIHGTALGIGERVGNASLEMLVHNLGLLGAREPVPTERLADYMRLCAGALAWELPDDHPLLG